MPKLFTDKRIQKKENHHVIQGEDARYLLNILRMQKGERITVGDGDFIDHIGEITELSQDSVTLQWISHEKNQAEPPYEAVLYQGILKGEKMDWVIQKSVELGVSKIVPFTSSRSVVRLDGKDVKKKTERWEKIAHEASRQSGRGKVPSISMPRTFSDAIKEAVKQSQYTFIPWEKEEKCAVQEFLKGCEGESPSISFFIGPEGGFSEAEIQLSQKAGITPVTLGKRILRAETAGLSVLSMLSYRFEDFSCIIKH